MATKKTATKKTAKAEPYLEADEDGYWWMIDGKNKTNLGRSKRYAEVLMEKENAK